MKSKIYWSFLISLALLMLISCKKEDNSFYEYSNPTFAIFQVDGQPETIYAYCASHDVKMDSIYVTSPLNIKSRLYYHGQAYGREVHFLIGDNFVYHTGPWTFTFYGMRAVNGLKFSVFIEQDF